jgi:nicotinamidase-related amidase
LANRTSDIADASHRRAGMALLIIDMIADFEFEDGDQLFEKALAAAGNIAQLKTRARECGVPVIYVNDNYGQWKNNFETTLAAAEKTPKGKRVIDLIRPDHDDYHVLKPQRSGFFATPLDVLLTSLDVSDLILTGISTDICVLFTAHDAYMRGFNLKVPVDCTAAVDDRHRDYVLDLLRRIADADTRPSTELEMRSAKAACHK